ncbi:hypothetical protein EXIGLDRAFT_736905 [Exidia glandulosa HHB12029]|uniref:Uncharacterized protein n=1 Tax=Exidia glandulosa HHB12029 TaxID=1314781 RepID=A0A165J9P2_EXIGL|nr:hypothetical protein EXIGLDRAFT_736905 [Exidia glandulosa HHB12029]
MSEGYRYSLRRCILCALTRISSITLKTARAGGRLSGRLRSSSRTPPRSRQSK